MQEYKNIDELNSLLEDMRSGVCPNPEVGISVFGEETGWISSKNYADLSEFCLNSHESLENILNDPDFIKLANAHINRDSNNQFGLYFCTHTDEYDIYSIAEIKEDRFDIFSKEYPDYLGMSKEDIVRVMFSDYLEEQHPDMDEKTRNRTITNIVVSLHENGIQDKDIINEGIYNILNRTLDDKQIDIKDDYKEYISSEHPDKMDIPGYYYVITQSDEGLSKSIEHYKGDGQWDNKNMQGTPSDHICAKIEDMSIEQIIEKDAKERGVNLREEINIDEERE